MKKPITVKPHLSVETIEKRYRQAKDPVERERVADHLATGAGQDDQSDSGSHRLLPGLDSHPRPSLQSRRASRDRRPSPCQSRRRLPPLSPTANAARRGFGGTAPGRRAVDWSQSSPVDPGPHGAQGASPARLGVSQTAELQQAGAAATLRQSRSCRPGSI